MPKIEPLAGDALMQMLRRLTPERARTFVVTEDLPHKLASNPEHKTRIYFGCDRPGAVKDFDEAKRVINFIEEAWRDYVKITRGEPYPDYIVVTFKVKKVQK